MNGACELVLCGGRSCTEVVQNASGPLLVEIDKLPGNLLGITLTQGRYRGRRVIYIDSVHPASIADRSVLFSPRRTIITRRRSESAYIRQVADALWEGHTLLKTGLSALPFI